MKKTLTLSLLTLVAAGLVFYGVSNAKSKKPKGDRILISKKVKSGPQDASSSQWQQANEAHIVLTGVGSVEGKTKTLTASSVYSNDKIFFRFSWPDPDRTMNKKRWKFSGGKWTQIKSNEDRLGVVWEIHRINKFATKGCTVFCHNQSKNEKDWYYAVDSPKEKADLWHWKSVRSNPVGYTEDGYVTTNPSKKPEEGRKRDAGSGKTINNRTPDKSKPAYMQDPSKKSSAKGSLLVSEAVKITDYSIFKKGDEIPGYLLNAVWKGSFADVKTKGVWKNGRWTVVMSRKLKTGFPDDVQFNPRKKYPFGIAAFNNSSEHNSYNSEPLKLAFR